MRANKSKRIAKWLLAFVLSITAYGILQTIEVSIAQQSPKPMSVRIEKPNIEFIQIPGGSFQIGDLWGDGRERDRPVHKVTVSDFEMSKYEITNGQFCGFLNDNGSQYEGGGLWLSIENQYCLITRKNGQFVPKNSYEEHPVVEVSWFGARAFAEYPAYWSFENGFRVARSIH